MQNGTKDVIVWLDSKIPLINPMNTFLFMLGGVNVGTSEIMIVSLAIFIVFLILRNFIVKPKE